MYLTHIVKMVSDNYGTGSDFNRNALQSVILFETCFICQVVTDKQQCPSDK
ncbi:hypothetical protein [Sodalis-like endosymbiont of Proechinophthirus fluctus]|uniref:hypothetical protein n=1 Tax=Sodalis-like endosymbiont of Proechinophthirus fluctus TaxID=1462730 RepID=UPI00164F38D4|nr:hypothetical protein [Sodalis-like endosymbiont of Proechinophthirus fluctus]